MTGTLGPAPVSASVNIESSSECGVGEPFVNGTQNRNEYWGGKVKSHTQIWTLGTEVGGAIHVKMGSQGAR